MAENAKATNLPLAEYARRQLMNEKLTAKYEIVADLPQLKKLIAEFGKIGSNLNRLPAILTAAASIHWKCGRLLTRASHEFMK